MYLKLYIGFLSTCIFCLLILLQFEYLNPFLRPNFQFKFQLFKRKENQYQIEDQIIYSSLQSLQGQVQETHRGQGPQLIMGDGGNKEESEEERDSSTSSVSEEKSGGGRRESSMYRSLNDETDGQWGGPYSGHFDLQMLNLHLKKCIQHNKDSEIPLDEYILAFQQLYKFFCLLGTVFSFVGSDIKSKLEILSAYRSESNVNNSKYATIEGMLAWEKSSDYIHTNKESSGSRTLLRLHRALNFVSIFLDKVKKLENGEEGTYKVCKEAYSQTLSKYHSWLIQKGATLAMLALPTKKELLLRVSGGGEESQAQGQGPEIISQGQGQKLNSFQVETLLDEVIPSIQSIYNQCEKAYKEYELQDLP